MVSLKHTNGTWQTSLFLFEASGLDSVILAVQGVAIIPSSASATRIAGQIAFARTIPSSSYPP